jgi:hypothetical protein
MGEEETGRWLFAIAKHLKAYALDARVAYLYATRRSALDGELLLRLRGSGTVGKSKLEAMAMDVGIAPQEIPQTIARLEATRLLSARRSDSTQEILEVRESIFTEREVYRVTAELFELAQPQPAERAIIPLLDLMSRLPLTEEEALAQVCSQGFKEEEVRKALELQGAFGLVRQQRVSDLGITLYYNEYLWGHKIERVGQVLAKLGLRETRALLTLLEEIQSAQGRPLDQITSVPANIVDLAAKTGILDTTTITTANGDTKTFGFSPHFYGYRAGAQPALIDDYSDQVKLFVASMTYGVNHSIDFRLHSPLSFISKLLREGEAGGATPILRDYVLLEKQGIITVEERIPNRGVFVLKKPDVVQQAFDIMSGGNMLDEGRTSSNVRSLISQRDFRSPEYNRLTAGFGRAAGNTQRFDHDLLAAVREEAQRGTW